MSVRRVRVVKETFETQVWVDKSGEKSRLIDENGHAYFKYRHRKNEEKASGELSRWQKYKCNQNKKRRCSCTLQIREDNGKFYFARGGEHNHPRKSYKRIGSFTKFEATEDNAKKLQIHERRRNIHISRQREILVDYNRQKTPLPAILTPRGEREHKEILRHGANGKKLTKHGYKKVKEYLFPDNG